MTPRRGQHRIHWRRDPATTPEAWAVGPWERGEFAALREELDPDRAWREAATLGAAIEQLDKQDQEMTPEVVLLAQPRPGVDEQQAVDRLHAIAPLARVVVVAGSWCEGELRTGRPLTGVTRIYWHELPAWWRQSLARRAAGLAPHWSGVGDRGIGADAGVRRDGPTTALAVDTIDYAVYEALAAALQPWGWECAWTPRGRGVSPQAAVGIWDGGQLDASEQDSLRDFCGQFSPKPAPVVALLDFPRVEHVSLVRELGAAALLGKPYRLESLVDQLGKLVQGAQGAQRALHERLSSRGAR